MSCYICGRLKASSIFTWGVFWILQLLGIAITCMTIVWLMKYKAGFNVTSPTPDHIYSWHPTLMSVALFYVLGTGIGSFQFFKQFTRSSIKVIHAGINLVALLLMFAGLYTIVHSRDLREPPKAHFTTLHSWIGIAAIACLALQLLLGSVLFMLPASWRSMVMNWHKKFGLSIFILGSISFLLGLQKSIKKGDDALILSITGVCAVLFMTIIILLLSHTHVTIVKKTEVSNISQRSGRAYDAFH